MKPVDWHIYDTVRKERDALLKQNEALKRKLRSSEADAATLRTQEQQRARRLNIERGEIVW